MTEEYEHYEAVVVGGGPAGSAAAASLAKRGVETLVLERGNEPGSKNVTGGLIYGEKSSPYTAEDLFPGFKEHATERSVDNYYMHNISGDKVKSFDISELHRHDTDWSFSVLRRKMDSWIGEKVHEITREKGGGLLEEVRVNGLLREDDEIVGVTCDELDPIKADIIVAADGINSELARDAGLMDWEDPEEYFQGVKAVIDIPKDELEDRFNIDENKGEAHLIAGDLFNGVRGGGAIYTNKDSLSITTVFHLDSLADKKEETQELLDNLLTHPFLQDWVEGGEEIEYSSKLTPDGKKSMLSQPYKDNMVVVGDAAGQLQAEGPVIKGMNLAISAGGLVGEAFEEGGKDKIGKTYAKKLKSQEITKKVKPTRYKIMSAIVENRPVTGLINSFLKSSIGRFFVRSSENTIKNMLSSPYFSTMTPDINTSYSVLPTIIAEELGKEINQDKKHKNGFEPKTLDKRIGDLTYNIDIGNPHIELIDNSIEASGIAVTACPVSAKDFGGGCYRDEGDEVSLDTQPCIECGTCAVLAETNWTHPSGGKGVEFKQG